MMNIEKKLQSVGNKLQILLPQFKRICAKNVSSIPIQIDKIVVGTNKLSLYVKNDMQYTLDEDDLKFVTTINARAFAHCTSLTSITIPDSVTSIGVSAFYNCTNLTDIYLKPITPPALFDTIAIPEHTTIHVPIGSGDTYKSATNWSSFANNIVEDIEI